VGSEVSGGVQHVDVERVQFKGTTQGIRLKSGRDRGGDLSDFTYKDITMEDVGTAIQITDYYGGDRAGAVTATAAPVTRLTAQFDGIHIENVRVTGAKVALDIEGLPEAPIRNLVMENVQIQAAKAGKIFYAQVQSRGLRIVPQDGQPLTVGTGVTGNLK
jgi:polygalacturonase